MEQPHYEDICIPTYIVYYKDEEVSICQTLKEFDDKPEFSLTAIEIPNTEADRKFPYWRGMIDAVKLAVENEEDVIIICTPSHRFSQHYSKSRLLRLITDASNKG